MDVDIFKLLRESRNEFYADSGFIDNSSAYEIVKSLLEEPEVLTVVMRIWPNKSSAIKAMVKEIMTPNI
jgi:hypothetical protein